jgi:hypothetical protein
MIINSSKVQVNGLLTALHRHKVLFVLVYCYRMKMLTKQLLIFTKQTQPHCQLDLIINKLSWAEPHSYESHSLNKIQLDQWLLRYSTFMILKSSSIGGCLHCKQFSILVWSPYLKFQLWLRSNQCLQRYSTFNILRSSSIGGCPHFKQFLLHQIKLIFLENPIGGCWDIHLLIFWGHITLEVVFISSNFCISD